MPLVAIKMTANSCFVAFSLLSPGGPAQIIAKLSNPRGRAARARSIKMHIQLSPCPRYQPPVKHRIQNSTIIESTVALIEFASSSLHTKVHLKKNPEVEKLDGKE